MNNITYMEGFVGRPSFALALPHKLDPVRFEFLLPLLDDRMLLLGVFSFLALMLFILNVLKSSGVLYFCNH